MNIRLIIFVYLILVIFFAVIIGDNIPKYCHLAKNATQATGIVTEVTASYHNTVCYQYTVNKTNYTGQTQPRFPNPPTAQLHIGDVLAVFIDPNSPDTSVISDPTALLKNELISFLPAIFIIPALIMLSIQSRYKLFMSNFPATQSPR